jgi:Flp pilus assembly protein TadD
LNPNHAPLRQNFGRFLSLTGADDEAARELEIANRLSPFDESILVDLARVRLRQGRRAEAESLLARALELRPADRTIRGLLEESRMSAP